MADFVTGTLVANEGSGIDPGAPSEPVERFLTVATTSGKTIEVFDYGITTAMPISGHVPLGNTYRYLLALMMSKIERSPYPTDPLPWKGSAGVDLWEAMVIDTDWMAPTQVYQCAFDGLDRSHWIILETPIGLAVASQASLHSMKLQAGDRLRWRQIRFDLLAIW